MINDTGAIARQRHYTSLRNTDREILRKTWSIGYGDPGYTTQLGTPPEPSTRHAATSIYKIITDALWLHRGACLACPWEGPDQRRRDAAIEDAHDHTHPEWRNLPILDRAPSNKGSRIWWLHVRARYPEGWFDAAWAPSALRGTALRPASGGSGPRRGIPPPRGASQAAATWRPAAHPGIRGTGRIK